MFEVCFYVLKVMRIQGKNIMKVISEHTSNKNKNLPTKTLIFHSSFIGYISNIIREHQSSSKQRKLNKIFEVI